MANFQDATAGYVSSFFGGAKTAGQQLWGIGFSALIDNSPLKILKNLAWITNKGSKIHKIFNGDISTIDAMDIALDIVSDSLKFANFRLPKVDVNSKNINKWALKKAIDGTQKVFKSAKYFSKGAKALVMDFEESLEKANQPQVGGILLDKCATITGNHPKISGAYWDSNRGAIVLYGPAGNQESSELALSGLEFDHLLVALRAAMAGEHLGVSIDPPSAYRDGIHKGTFPPDGTPMIVSYLGNTEGTLFGTIMFEADRVMKCLSKETDNTSGKSFRAETVKGYKSLFELFNQYGSGGSGSWFRFWFVIDLVEIAHDPAERAFRFGNVRIKVLNETELIGGEKTKQDSASTAFANHLTEYYDQYAKEFPILIRLKEIAKISALARFLVNQGISINHQTIFKQPPLPVPTPESTPGIIASSNSSTGSTQLIFGGVDMDIDPTIINKNDKEALLNRELAQATYPGSLFSSWSFNTPKGPLMASAIKLNGTNQPYRALSNSDHSFSRSMKDSIRSIRRYYDSSVPGGDFGPGWWLFLPYRLQVIPKSMKRNEVLLQSEKTEDINPSVIVLHNFVNPGSNVYRRYKDADNHQGKAYCKVTHQQIIKKGLSYSVKQSDVIYFHDNFYTFSDNKFSFRFDGKGQLSEARTAKGFITNYKWYDGSLTDIEFGSGINYKIKYDRNHLHPKIDEITASEGVILKYNYQDGFLAECFVGNSKKVSYNYDNLNRISETRNSEGIVVKRNTYDDKGNLIENQECISDLSDGTNMKREILNGRIVKVTDESGGIAEYKYRKDGTLATIHGLSSGMETGVFSYDKQGKIIELKDYMGVNHKFTYYPSGDVKHIEGSDGSWIELPLPENLNEEISGSYANLGDWKIIRDKSGLPQAIIDSKNNKHRFKYNKKGLKSIKSPDCAVNVTQNNGISKFEMKYNTGIKQNILIEPDKSSARISTNSPRRNSNEISLNDNGYILNDSAGSVECQFDKDRLLFDVSIDF